MWTLWLALGLAVASAAPQEAFREVLESEFGVTEEILSDDTTMSSLGEAITTSFPDSSLGVTKMNIKNLTGKNENFTSEVTDASRNLNTSEREMPYPEELYFPDADPIDNTIDDTLGSDDILDVIKNFIADRDPMLQLFLSICFIQPTCYQLDSPSPIVTALTMASLSPLSQQLAGHLAARRTETARNLLVDEVMNVQRQIKGLMFKYIQEGVGARGVSILATKTIIDSIKDIWLSLNSDLEYAKSSIQELFYILPLDTKEQVQSMLEIAEVVQRIPDKTEVLLQEATQQGYQQYVRSSSWNSWKRKGGE